MAGIIKRSNKWVAVFKTLDGKEVRKTTRIDVVPKVIPPGANKRAVIAQNEARARLIAEELEHGHKTGFVDSQRLKAIAGGDVQAASLGRKAVSVGAYLHEWLQSRSGKIQAHERDGKAIKQFILFLGNDGGQVSLSEMRKSLINDLYGALKSYRDKERDSGALRYRNVSDKSIYDTANEFVNGEEISNKLVYALLDKYRPSDAESRRAKIFDIQGNIERSDISLQDKGFNLGDMTFGDGGYLNAYKSYAETVETLEKEYEESEKSLISAKNDEEIATRKLSDVKRKNASEAAVDIQRGRTSQAQERRQIREETEKEDTENEIEGRKKEIETKKDALKKNKDNFSAELERLVVAAGESASEQQKAMVRAASEAIRNQVKNASADGIIDSAEYTQIGVAFRDALRQQGIQNTSILNGLTTNMKQALSLVNQQAAELRVQQARIDQLTRELKQAQNNIGGLRRRKH